MRSTWEKAMVASTKYGPRRRFERYPMTRLAAVEGVGSYVFGTAWEGRPKEEGEGRTHEGRARRAFREIPDDEARRGGGRRLLRLRHRLEGSAEDVGADD